MARNAHAYVRGSTKHFYEWLASASARLPQGPAIWICGDCHVGNIGPVGKSDGHPVIELRDLDQAAIANPAYDVVRLALSLAMAARGSDLSGVTTARMTEELVAGYERAFAGDLPTADPTELPRPLRVIMKRAIKRTWKKLFRERLGEGELELPIGKRFWALTDDERDALERLVNTDDVRHLITAIEDRGEDAKIRLHDAAYWVKGCSSLGLFRAAVIVEVMDRDKKQTSCLLDVKQAGPTSAPSLAGLPDDHAKRVVAGAKKLAPALGERMVACHVLDRSVFVRELLPQDLKCELDELSTEDARGVANYLGMVVGRAHGRQLNASDKAAWLAELSQHRSKTLDAPNWLWRAVVDLVAIHEAAYLEHCRLYALDPA